MSNDLNVSTRSSSSDYKNAVYRCTSTTSGGTWKDANDVLDVRGKNPYDTINNDPKNAIVPRVYTWTGSDWDQIYPAKEQTTTITFFEDDLAHYQHPTRGWKNGKTVKGKYIKGRAAQGYFGVDKNYDWDDDGNRDDMDDVWKEHVGWLGLGPEQRKRLPGAGGVIKITSLKFKLYRRSDAGCAWHTFPLTLRKSKIRDHYGNTTNNPYNGNWVGGLVGYGTVTNVTGGKNKEKEITIDLNTSDGKAMAQLVMDWMKGVGGTNSILLYNGETSEDCRKHTEYGGYWGQWSNGYMKVNHFGMTVSYVYAT